MNTPRVNKTAKGVSKVSTVVHSGGQSSGSRLKTPTMSPGSRLKTSTMSPGSRLKTSMMSPGSRSMVNSYDWLSILSRDRNGTRAVSVSSFKYAPLCDVWEDLVTCGLKVEVRNTDTDLVSSDGHTEGYWIASVVKFAGYYVLLRYEGFASDSSKDFWVNIFTNLIHPVGWCASQGKVLIPPKTVESKFNDWREFLVKRLTGSRTLPENFNEQLRDSLKSRFSIGMRLEVVDKKRISAVRVAFVDQIIGGRLHIIYEGEEDTDTGFWCHQFSPLIHPVGWAQLVGHELRATKEYAEESLRKAMTRSFDDKDAEWTLFPPVKTTLGPTSGSTGPTSGSLGPTSGSTGPTSGSLGPTSGSTGPTSGSTGLVMHGNHPTGGQSSNAAKFEEGMKLEAIDPLNLSTICVATVTKVLRSNYLMIGIDGMMAADGSDWFCYHASSPCIFPVGFCHFNRIELTPPRNHVGEFDWMKYLNETGSRPAPVSLFKKEIPSHGFKEGSYLEAVDLMEPRLICVATVTKVVGRLLRVHFNGWDDSYDQWCDCESPELFPAGWCQLVGYPLEPPKGEGDSFTAQTHDSRRKKGNYKGKRGRKRSVKNGSQLCPSSGPSLGDGTLSDSLRDRTLSDSLRDRTLSGSVNEGSIEEDDEEMEEDEENFEHNQENNTQMTVGDSLLSTHNNTQMTTHNTPHNTQMMTHNTQMTTHNTQMMTVGDSLLSPHGRQSVSQRLGQSAERDLVSNTPATIRPVGRMSKSPGSSHHLHSSGLPNSSVIVKPSPPEPVIQLDGKNPIKWSVREVSYFLKTNNAAGYIHSFAEQGIDGAKLLQLTEEAVMKLTDNKVGPALKIKALIETLKKGKR